MPTLDSLFSAGGFLKWDGAGNTDADYSSNTAAQLAADPAFTGAFVGRTSAGRHAPVEQRNPLAPTVKVLSSETTVEQATVAFYALADVTGATVSYIVPPSGMVDLAVTAAYKNLGSSLSDWWIRDALGICRGPTGVLASSGTGAASSGNSIITRLFRIAQDGAGTPLVPGAVHTVKLSQSSGPDSHSQTNYGGSCGNLVMRVEPVSHRFTERPVSQSINAAATYRPVEMSIDRATLIGIKNAANVLAWSTDDGATWTEHAYTGWDSALSTVRHLDNGELLVAVGQGDGGGAYVSSGWATDKATATFTKTLAFTGSPPEATYGAHPGPWSVDAWGPYALLAEYGPKDGTADMARYVYWSEDFGLTWTTIFDLAEKRPDNGSVNAHLHGVCYDPWWDAIWVVNGDDAQRGIWVSFDHGGSWEEVLDGQTIQPTTVAPMPDCILFISDINPDGIYRIPRVSPKYLEMELALSVGSTGSIEIVGTGWYRNRSMPDAPMLLSSYAVAGPGRVWATYDGYTFAKVFEDTITYTDIGVNRCVGPTLTNKLHAFVVRGTTDSGDWDHATISLA